MDKPSAPSPKRAVVVDESALPLEGWAEGGRGPVAWRTLLSADRTPSEGLTMGVAEVGAAAGEEAGDESRLHRHAQAEAYYILAGEGTLEVEGETWPLRPGVAAFIPGAAWHAARAAPGSTLRLLYVFPAASFADVIYEFQDEG